MLVRLLIAANVLLAIALGRLVHLALPYADGVSCETAERFGRACQEPTSLAMLWLLSLVPSGIVVAVVAAALKARKSFVAPVLLSLVPVATAVAVVPHWL